MSARSRFANYLGDARVALGISQKDLAGAIGVDASMVNRWERGIQLPLAKYLPLLAQHLKLDSTEFILLRSEASAEEAKQARSEARIISEENKALRQDVLELRLDVSKLTAAVQQLLAELQAQRPS